jgi:hypothetical protein
MVLKEQDLKNILYSGTNKYFQANSHRIQVFLLCYSPKKKKKKDFQILPPFLAKRMVLSTKPKFINLGCKVDFPRKLL